jgi:hypothetical protein
VTEKQLLPTVLHLAKCHRRAKKHNLKAVFEKYKEDTYHSVSISFEPLTDDAIRGGSSSLE